MSTREPGTEPPARVDAIGEPRFAMVWRGYDPEQVQRHVKALADRLMGLEDQAGMLGSGHQEARTGDNAPSSPPADPLETVSDRVAAVIRAFDQDVERMRREAEAEAQLIRDKAADKAGRAAEEVAGLLDGAKAEAKRILSDAETEADRVRVDAQAKAEDTRAQAEQTLDDARREADQVLGDLQSRRATLIDEIRAMRQRLLDTAKDLEPVGETDETVERVVVP